MNHLKAKFCSLLAAAIFTCGLGCGKSERQVTRPLRAFDEHGSKASQRAVADASAKTTVFTVETSIVSTGRLLEVAELESLLEVNYGHDTVFTNGSRTDIFDDLREPNLHSLKILSRSKSPDGTSAVCLLSEDGQTLDQLDLKDGDSMSDINVNCAELWVKHPGHSSVRLSADGEDARAALLSKSGRHLAYFSRETRSESNSLNPKIVLRGISTGNVTAWHFSHIPNLVSVCPIQVDDSGLSVAVVVTFGEAHIEHRKIELQMKPFKK